ncbi:MAG: PAS domain-containing protein [Alphaproteobacteria bacterium]|nr:PAS domain-containing protein [Alphaproteobacteria bacterium]
MPNTVHIVDDDPSVRAALSYLLSSHGYPTQIYASGAELLGERRSLTGCLLLDLKMSDTSGLEVLEEMARRGSQLPAIAMSGERDLPAAVQALKLGAVDYLQKPHDPDELVLAIERVRALADHRTHRSATRASATARLRSLSPRQRQILRGLIAGMTNKEIARRLDLSPRTVEMHRRNLLRDLGVRTTSAAIRLGIEAELTPLETPDDGTAPTAAALAPLPTFAAARRQPSARNADIEEMLPPALDVLEGTSDGVFLLDHDFNFTYANRNALEIMGDSCDLIGRNIWEVLPGGARTRLYDECKATAEQRKASRFTFYGPTLGKWLDINVRPIPSGLLLLFRDLSRERAALAELRLSEERLRLALEASGDGAWDWNIADDTMTLSPRFLVGLGYDPETVSFRSDILHNLIHPADWPEVDRQMREHLAGRSEVFACEYRVRRRDGGWAWVFERGRVVAHDPRTGNSVRMVGTVSDTSALKEMQARAQEALERIALAQQLAGAGTWELDLTTRIATMSGRTREMHGLAADADEAIPELMWEAILHPDDLERTKAALKEAVDTGTTYSAGYRAVAPDGECRWLRALGRPLRAADGVATRFVGIVLDETERHKSAQELQRAQDELANVCRLTALGTVMTSLAHELRQPLTAIRGYSSALRHTLSASPGSRFAEALDGIEESAILADDILAGAEMPSRWTQIDARAESLGEITRSAANIAVGTAEVQFAVAPEADGVRVDRVHLQQVMMNLIRNATDAMQEGGGRKITISAVPVSDEEVEVRVSDEGPGIPANVRDRLFSPFVTMKSGGTGIGLSICRTIIEAHGGRIWLASGPDRGAVIAFTLPRA